MPPEPMLATSDGGNAMTMDMEGYAYEPKLDGMRILAVVSPSSVALFSRDGNNKADQFGEVLPDMRRLPQGTILDGEIVSTDAQGNILSFQTLSSRIHLTLSPSQSTSVSYVVFDILHDGTSDTTTWSLKRRRERLVELFETWKPASVQLVDQSQHNGSALYILAVARSWEGLMIKRLSSLYRQGKRTSDWTKLKFARRQEFVVFGFTRPNNGRKHFGSLMLGVMRDGRLIHVGDVGSGFSEAELESVKRLLEPSDVDVFDVHEEREYTLCKPLVADVQFQEWTHDWRLRHPVWIGFRDDKAYTAVTREP